VGGGYAARGLSAAGLTRGMAHRGNGEANKGGAADTSSTS